MRRLLTAAEAKALDRYTITEVGVPSVVLMERASLAVAEACEDILRGERTAFSCGIPKSDVPKLNGALKKSSIPENSVQICASKTRILSVCAMGNNGADGVAVARILYLKGYAAQILLIGDEAKATEEMKLQLAIARNLEIPVCKADEEKEYIRAGEYDLIIDAIFGVGLTRPVEGQYASLVRQINESQTKVVAVDIPSGVSSDDGKVLGCAVKTDVTVTFGAEKLGMILYPGTEYCGRRVIADIGLAEEKILRSAMRRG